MNPTDGQNGQNNVARRGFLHVCIAGMGAIGGALLAFPVFSFLRLPKRLGGITTITTPIAELTEDQARYFDRQGVQIVVVYTNKEPKVFDAACTHLGCVTAWDPNDHVFRCPCHGAVFDDNGEVVSGPVNKPLKKIKFEIKNEQIIIA